jgi:YidC/Oxa1 family membrane protein insertase
LGTVPELPWFLASPAPHVASFATDTADNVRITKTLTLQSGQPFHTLSVTVTNRSKEPKTITIPLSWTGGLDKHLVRIVTDDQRSKNAARAEMRVVAFRDRPQSWRPGFFMNRKIDSQFAGPFEWVGVDNHHFLAALLPKEGSLAAVHVIADRKNPPAFELPLEFSLAPGETKAQSFELYVGPKNYEKLKKVGHHLDQAVDFGTFGVISKGLLRMLEFFKATTKNYGWAIILLTISIQILVLPLTKRSLSHAVRMKELQPQIKQLQEQFKSDPKRMQIEMFNLYRKNGMKFMGMEGCFPILLQLPIFFAFYRTLSVAYELRGASWLWIPDLGLHDPIYVLPVLMGIGMFIQQRATTVTADPAQARMMMFMPVFMTFMFLKLPAGLVLYWSVNSVCTITIQKVLQWRQHAAPKTT